MRLKLNAILSGPKGSRGAGSILVDADVAELGLDVEDLVKRGYAEVLPELSTEAAPAAVEDAAATVETAAVEVDAENASASDKPAKKKG